MKKRMEKYTQLLNELISSNLYDFNTTKRKEIPKTSGVYAIYHNTGGLLYVGTSKNIQNRIYTNHKHGNMKTSAFRISISRELGTSNEKMISEYIVKNCKFRIIGINDEHLRKKFEHFAIALLDPKLND